MNAIVWDVPRCYSGRPTRKQRRKMRHRREWEARPTVRVVDGRLVWARNVKAGEVFTITDEHFRMAAQRPAQEPKPFEPKSYFFEEQKPETITINGEQVPATIVKDPTK